jgi:hypothetical protein
MPVTGGNVSARSTSVPGGRSGMKVPWLNWMPKNSPSWGMGTVVAPVSDESQPPNSSARRDAGGQ